MEDFYFTSKNYIFSKDKKIANGKNKIENYCPTYYQVSYNKNFGILFFFSKDKLS